MRTLHLTESLACLLFYTLNPPGSSDARSRGCVESSGSEGNGIDFAFCFRLKTSLRYSKQTVESGSVCVVTGLQATRSGVRIPAGTREACILQIVQALTKLPWVQFTLEQDMKTQRDTTQRIVVIPYRQFGTIDPIYIVQAIQGTTAVITYLLTYSMDQSP